MNKESKLFKDTITFKEYKTLIARLREAVDAGEAELTELLCGTRTPEIYKDHGTFVDGQHNCCEGFKTETFTEKRLCKCMYYTNSLYPKNCEKCAFKERFHIVGDYKIRDCEIPAYYYEKGIGGIDLIIEGDNVLYATEVKPYKNNRESILRMVAEILTYTVGDENAKYKKAIAFFETARGSVQKTTQQKEYDCINQELMELIKEAGITIFRFEETGEKEYKICKL